MVYGTVVVDINAMNESLARLDDTIARLKQLQTTTQTQYDNFILQ